MSTQRRRRLVPGMLPRPSHRVLLIAPGCFTALAYAIFQGGISVGRITLFQAIGGLSCGLLCYLWCRFDAAERRFKLGKTLRVSLVLIFGVAFPIYVFRTRGSRGFLTLFLAGLYFLVLILASTAGVLLTGQAIPE